MLPFCFLCNSLPSAGGVPADPIAQGALLHTFVLEPGGERIQPRVASEKGNKILAVQKWLRSAEAPW